MGNNRSLDVSSTHLDDQMIDEITKKTGFSRNEVIKWHQEFLVKLTSICFFFIT